jgi:hypothetical protein
MSGLWWGQYTSGGGITQARGKIGFVRWISLLLLSVLMPGQFHLCEASYRLPSGKVCAVCPQLVEDETHDIAASHGDCHDCCTIQRCDDSASRNLSSFTAFDLLLPVRVNLEVARLPEVTCVANFVESAPATGPPGSQSSRAPPQVMSDLSSAGRDHVILP